MQHYKTSHRMCYMKKGALKNFAKFTGKRLFQSFTCFPQKDVLKDLLKKRLQHMRFLVNFWNFWNSFFYSFFHFWVTASGTFSKDIEKSAGS